MDDVDNQNDVKVEQSTDVQALTTLSYESEFDGLDAIEVDEEWFKARPERYRYLEKTGTYQDKRTGKFVRSFGNPNTIRSSKQSQAMHIRKEELKLKGQDITRNALTRATKSRTWEEAWAQLASARAEQALDLDQGMASVKAHELLARLAGLDNPYERDQASGARHLTLIDKLLIVDGAVRDA